MSSAPVSSTQASAASAPDGLYYSDAHVRLYGDDCRALLPRLPAECVDAVVTDPPYHLLAASRRGSRRANSPDHPFRSGAGPRGFMGQPWDGGAVAFEADLWAEVLRVSKPGAHLLAFGGTRTSHRLATAIEDAGWEIRDCLVWAYASGFPKSRNLDGVWTGWGTALKPAWEPDTYGDSGGFSRFFLIPKASRQEREAGLHPESEHGSLRSQPRRNHHPTVKPVALLRHLVRLVTPLDGTVLDPFVGSGSTAIAAVLEGVRCLAVEMEPEYVAIAAARLRAAR